MIRPPGQVSASRQNLPGSITNGQRSEVAFSPRSLKHCPAKLGCFSRALTFKLFGTTGGGLWPARASIWGCGSIQRHVLIQIGCDRPRLLRCDGVPLVTPFGHTARWRRVVNG